MAGFAYIRFGWVRRVRFALFLIFLMTNTNTQLIFWLVDVFNFLRQLLLSSFLYQGLGSDVIQGFSKVRETFKKLRKIFDAQQ